MNTPRSNFVLVADPTNRRLYAMAGMSMKSKMIEKLPYKALKHQWRYLLTDSVEYYEFDAGRWHMTDKLKIARTGFAAVLVQFLRPND